MIIKRTVAGLKQQRFIIQKPFNLKTEIELMTHTLNVVLLFSTSVGPLVFFITNLPKMYYSEITQTYVGWGKCYLCPPPWIISLNRLSQSKNPFFPLNVDFWYLLIYTFLFVYLHTFMFGSPTGARNVFKETDCPTSN